MPHFVADCMALADHLGLTRFDMMGYSMGARITAFAAMLEPQRVRSAILGGLGIHLVDQAGLPFGIAEAMEAPDINAITLPMARLFRLFAQSTQSDLAALAACIRGARQAPTAASLARITAFVLICVGSNDDIAGDGAALAALIPGARSFSISDRDHNLAVGDKTYKAAVLAFLTARQ